MGIIDILLEKNLISMLMLEECSFNYIGGIFNVLNTIYKGHGSRKEYLELDASIIETMKYRNDYIPPDISEEIVPYLFSKFRN